MNRDKLVVNSKNYLIDIHDTLRRAFKNAPEAEQVFVNNVLSSIETDVKQLEMLQEMMVIWKRTKDKQETEIESEE